MEELNDLIPIEVDSTMCIPIEIKVSDVKGTVSPYIETVKFSGGNIDLNITPGSLTDLDAYITIEIDGLKNGDDKLTIALNPPSHTINPKPIVLTNYVLTTNTHEHDSLTLNYHVSIDNPRLGAIMAPGRLEADYSLKNLDWERISGYFGVIGVTDSVDLDMSFFEDLQMKQTMGMTDISLQAKVTNYLGLSMLIDTKIDAIDKGGTTLSEADSPLKLSDPFKIVINPATESDEELTPVVTPYTPTVTLDLKEGKYPAKLLFDLSGTTNVNLAGDTLANLETVTNFIKRDPNSDTLVKVDVDLTIPLTLKTTAYVRHDTIEFDFNDLIKGNEETSESVAQVDLYLKVDNGLPFDIILGASALDKDGTVVHQSFIKDKTIKSAVPPSNTPTHSDLTITLEQDLIKEFREKGVKKIEINTVAASYNTGADYVSVKGDASLEIAVYVSFKANIPSSIF
jgi:hypothetical protein